MSAVPSPSPSFVEKGVIVRHNPGAKPSVDTDQDPIYLRSDLGDELVWTCDHPGKSFRIFFVDKSPFDNWAFDEKNNRSGPIRAGATGEYKYSIAIDGKVNDPKIIIQP